MQQLLPAPPRSSSHCNPGDVGHGYTSLCDVLLCPRYNPILRSALGTPLSLLTPQQAICIKNRLVKHAALAYVQSANAAAAAVAAEGRRNGGVRRMWRWQESWRAWMSDPFERGIEFVARSVGRALACVVSHLTRLCAWGRRSVM